MMIYLKYIKENKKNHWRNLMVAASSFIGTSYHKRYNVSILNVIYLIILRLLILYVLIIKNINIFKKFLGKKRKIGCKVQIYIVEGKNYEHKNKR